jgi:hypothetical protein
MAKVDEQVNPQRVDIRRSFGSSHRKISRLVRNILSLLPLLVTEYNFRRLFEIAVCSIFSIFNVLLISDNGGEFGINLSTY